MTFIVFFDLDGSITRKFVPSPFMVLTGKREKIDFTILRVAISANS
jgi:hypothetical protein